MRENNRNQNAAPEQAIYTDNPMSILPVERFFRPQTIIGRIASADGPISTFPLRGIKDAPPYRHDGRLLSLHVTVELFNLLAELKLLGDQNSDPTAFVRMPGKRIRMMDTLSVKWCGAEQFCFTVLMTLKQCQFHG